MEIIPRVHCVQTLSCNSYILAGEVITLIDTGFPGHAQKIVAYVRERLGRKESDIKTIILTHCDFDHIGNVRELKRLSGASIAAHRIEAEYLAGRKMRSGPPDSKWDVRIIYRMINVWMKLTQKFPINTDYPLEEGDIVSGLKVLHVPGHTAGSIALYDECRKVLFSGDSLVYASGAVHGTLPKLTMCPERVSASYNKLLSLDFEIMLAGHGVPLMPNAAARIRALKIV